MRASKTLGGEGDFEIENHLSKMQQVSQTIYSLLYELRVGPFPRLIQSFDTKYPTVLTLVASKAFYIH